MSDDLRQLLADVELLTGIEEGKVSPAELAHRVVLLGTSGEVIVVPRGFFQDEMMRKKVGDNGETVGEAAYDEYYDSDECVAAHLAQMEENGRRYDLPAPPKPDPVHVEEPPPPGSTDDESHPPEDEKPDSMLAKVRRAIGRS